MLYVLIFVLFVIAIWGLLLYVRKSQWDTIHRNLLDLEDNYEGKVIRRGFAARPFFYGKINGHSLTLNISSEKLGKERLNYFDISWGMPTSESFTISEKGWLSKHRDQEVAVLPEIENDYGQKFALIHKDPEKAKEIMQHPAVKPFINDCKSLCYIFLGKTGIICEFSAENLAEASKYESLKKRFELIKTLGEAFKQ
ncbi:hypothetical protein DRI50_05650 [candidate division KSB1 bacterium]|nr:MAG: hypothetical protein DRI50_05650 [candidate division KSB1 bacterium]